MRRLNELLRYGIRRWGDHFCGSKYQLTPQQSKDFIEKATQPFLEKGENKNGKQNETGSKKTLVHDL